MEINEIININKGKKVQNENKKEYIVKNNENINKLKSHTKENEIFISAKRLKFGKKFFYNFYLKRVKKLIDKGHKSIIICGLGTLSELALNLSNFCIQSIPKMQIIKNSQEDIEVIDYISKNDEKIDNVLNNLDLIDNMINSELNQDIENSLNYDENCEIFKFENNNGSNKNIEESEVKRIVKLLKITIYKS